MDKLSWCGLIQRRKQWMDLGLYTANVSDWVARETGLEKASVRWMAYGRCQNPADLRQGIWSSRYEIPERAEWSGGLWKAPENSQEAIVREWRCNGHRRWAIQWRWGKKSEIQKGHHPLTKERVDRSASLTRSRPSLARTRSQRRVKMRKTVIHLMLCTLENREFSVFDKNEREMAFQAKKREFSVFVYKNEWEMPLYTKITC